MQRSGVDATDSKITDREQHTDFSASKHHAISSSTLNVINNTYLVLAQNSPLGLPTVRSSPYSRGSDNSRRN